jgi:hypothetical protein
VLEGVIVGSHGRVNIGNTSSARAQSIASFPGVLQFHNDCAEVSVLADVIHVGFEIRPLQSSRRSHPVCALIRRMAKFIRN